MDLTPTSPDRENNDKRKVRKEDEMGRYNSFFGEGQRVLLLGTSCFHIIYLFGWVLYHTSE